MFEKIPTPAEVENAFQPAKEIDVPKKFAGRKDAVDVAYKALLTAGSHIAIIGNRGIGKTSLARQVDLMARGNHELLDRLKVKTGKPLDFLTAYLACGGSVENHRQLLERLLTSKTCLRDWVYDVPKAQKVMETYTPRFNAAVVSFGGEKKTEAETVPAIQTQDVETVFVNVAQSINDTGAAKSGLLIILDEYDQIRQPAGFASFLKSISTNVPNVKFCLVGVAQDLQNLIKEHESVDRLFAGSIVSLDPMADEELHEIVDIAEGAVGGYIKFDGSARRRLTELAQGHPYMVHLIGKYAMRRKHSEDGRVVTDADIDATLVFVAESESDPILEGRYKKAVGASPQREVVLKAMAESAQKDAEIFTGQAYKLALERGVDNASQYVGQLVTEQYGDELVKVRERYYRFRDSLFAAYVLARPPQFDLADESELF